MTEEQTFIYWDDEPPKKEVEITFFFERSKPEDNNLHSKDDNHNTNN